jgi:hypothetical protein
MEYVLQGKNTKKIKNQTVDSADFNSFEQVNREATCSGSKNTAFRPKLKT